MKNNKKFKLNKTYLTAAVIIVIAAIAIYNYIAEMKKPMPVPGETAFVYYLDVGQGDSEIIACDSGEYILIDAGPNSAEATLKADIDRLGINCFEYAIFTHPHEDHIGNGDFVLENYKVKNVIIPECEHTSSTYLRLLDAIDKSGAKVIFSEVGKSYTVGDGSFTILAPAESNYVEINNYSVVIRYVFGDTAFLFAGDAEMLSEREILSRFGGGELKADVLKVGHHGSSSSTSEEFLAAVDPDYAVIECATPNSYGHPYYGTLDLFEQSGITCLRTDREGNITFTTDGKSVKQVEE